MNKRFAVTFAVLLFFLFAFAKPAFAYIPQNWQDSRFAPAFDECRNTNAVQGECYVDRTTSSIMVSQTCNINFEEGICSDDPGIVKLMWPKSAIGMTNQIIAATYTVPVASTYAFFRDMAETLGFVPKAAHAQGIGFTGMAPLLDLWKAFRNIAYLILAVIMIVIGFMVMLRKRIDPKTVVTVQNALPKIIVTLLLITFSYAIVGLLIDLMYIILFLVMNVFVSVGGLTDPNPASTYIEGTLWQNLFNIKISKWQLLGINVPAGGWSRLLDIGAVTLGGLGIAAGAFTLEAPVVGIPLLTLGGALAASVPLFAFIYSVFILIIFVRLTILFVSAYIQVVLAMLLGPIQLLLEAVPGTNSFSSWMANLIANLSVFPVAGAMFMLANVFTNFATSSASGAFGENLWAPPYLGLFGNNAPSNTAIASLIALGLVATIPSVAGSIKEKLKASPFINAGPEALIAPVTAGGGQAFQLAYQYAMIKSLWSHGAPPSSNPMSRMKNAGEGGISAVTGGGHNKRG